MKNETNEKAKRRRLFFVDNLRILLTVLVILHHLAITYGGPGGWYYQDGRLNRLPFLVVTILLGINQSFFMGFFYLISGYFTPGSYDRKGAARFFLDRLVRLGIPLVVYVLLINPLVLFFAQRNVWRLRRPFLSRWGPNGDFWNYVALYLRDRRQLDVGPMWFVEALLIFAAVYVLWRLLARPTASQDQGESRMPGNLAVAAFALTMGLVTFLVRTRLPVGWVLHPWGLQLPHFTQYIGLFVAGLVAYRRNWFLRISEAQGRLWTGIAILLVAMLALLLAAGKMNIDAFLGGVRWEAFAFAVWEQFMGVAMVIALLVLFRERFDRQGPLAREMAASSYAAYIVHPPVLVLLATGLRQFRWPPLVKFALLTPVATVLCFGIAYLLRKLPLANRVL